MPVLGQVSGKEFQGQEAARSVFSALYTSPTAAADELLDDAVVRDGLDDQ